MKNLGFLKHFIRIYIPGSGTRAGPKNLWLRLQQKVAAPPAPASAPQHFFLLFPFKFETILIIQKLEKKAASTIWLTLVCFQKVILVYRRVDARAGAASQFLLGARFAKMAPQQ
jgi:hypothetical protein